MNIWKTVADTLIRAHRRVNQRIGANTIPSAGRLDGRLDRIGLRRTLQKMEATGRDPFVRSKDPEDVAESRRILNDLIN